MIRATVVFLLCLLAGAAAQAGAQSPAPPGELRILFIGNGLTYANDLPARLARVAEATGRRATVQAVAFSGYSLEDHWKEGTATRALQGKWDVVVLQQDSSESPASRAQLIEFATRFAKPIRESGARPALYMVWPVVSRPKEFSAVIEAYRAAAQAADALVLPAGEAWLRALSEDSRLNLYSDRILPTAVGSDLAVLTIYLSLFPAGPQEFDEAFVAKIASVLGIPARSRDLFFDAATRAIDSPLPIR